METFDGGETDPGAVMGARVASRRSLIVAPHIRRSLTHAVKLRGVSRMPHIALVIECLHEKGEMH